ncbi:MAG: BolA family transcriptional regulator [Aliidiomarina sp.]|uniref:BolA family protein n=1 Tax=Aliidiomarina sp. TaxID=1872439 RepID=UPI0025BAFB4D|nr:BolA family protein [Aliidiomarina sp.]MCH8501259.1 BolA family transcriptional regulator [Aliidiomarina sp.]
MDPKDIEVRLKDAIDLTEVHVTGENSHYQVIAVGEVFADLSRVKQQQLIYAPLQDKIADGSIHALTIKAYTPEKWRREKLLNMPG